MALTDTQKAQVRRALGYPDIYREPSNLESAFGALSPEGEAVVVELLGELAALRERMTAAQGQQGLKRVEDVEFFGAASLTALGAEGNRLARELAGVFGVEPRRLPFASGWGGGPCLRG